MGDAVTNRPDAMTPMHGPPPDPGAYSFGADADGFRHVADDVAGRNRSARTDDRDDALQPPPNLRGDTDGNGPGPAGAPVGSASGLLHRGACAVVGGVVGAASGALVGAAGEGLAGMAIGTLAAPGVGTLAGAGIGAADGVKNGAVVGGAVGAIAGGALCGGIGVDDHIAAIGNSDGTEGAQGVAKPAAEVSPDRRRHILDGDVGGGGHRPGTGNSGKSEFPAGWSDDKIIQNVQDVANDPASIRTIQPNGRTRVEGVRDGISIRVIVDSDGISIRTAHPTNMPANP